MNAKTQHKVNSNFFFDTYVQPFPFSHSSSFVQLLNWHTIGELVKGIARHVRAPIGHSRLRLAGIQGADSQDE